MGRILFLVGFICCWLGCVHFPKTEKMNALCAIMLGYMTTLCYGAVGAFVLARTRVGVTMLGAGFTYLILAICLWAYILFSKKMQKMEWRKCDFIGVLIGVFLVGFFSLHIFTVYVHVNYANTVDPSSHYIMAMNTLRNGSLSVMYFTQFHNAMFIGLLQPFLPETWTYKAFILADCFQTLMEYYVFYAFFVFLFRKNSKKYLPSVITVLFWLGYPLYNLLNGAYVYWAMGAAIVVYIIWLLIIFEEKEDLRKKCLILLCLGCFGLMTCYAQFLPGALLAIICVWVQCYAQNIKASFGRKQIIRIGCVLIGIMLIAGCAYYFRFYKRGLDVFQALKVGINSSRSIEIIITFPVIYYMLYKSVKNRKMDAIVWSALSFYFVHALFTVLASVNIVSSYYLFKNHFILWILMFCVFIYCWKNLVKKEKEYINHYIFLLCGFLLLIYMPYGKMDSTDNLSLDNSIYRYNFVILHEHDFRDSYVERKMNFIEYVAETYDNSEYRIAMITTNEIKGTCQWYAGITNQPYYFKSPISEEDVEEYVRNANITHIIMFYESEAYSMIGDYIDTFEKIYDCEEGFIASVSLD